MIEPQPLPYPYDALEPWISADAMALHVALYERYVDTVRRAGSWPTLGAARDWGIANCKLDLVFAAEQAWSHQLFFAAMDPSGGREPGGWAGDLIRQGWGSYARFRQDFIDLMMEIRGSGWLWLVRQPNAVPRPDVDEPPDPAEALHLIATPNSCLPPGQPVLVCDAWEHAFVLDFRSNKRKYAETWIDHLAFWEMAERLV